MILTPQNHSFSPRTRKVIGEARNPQGALVKNRITWSPVENGDVRQLWESSPDGKTWTVSFDGRYVREKPAR